MATRSANKAENYSRITARAITTWVLVNMLLTGCATRPSVKFSDTFDEQAIAAEITASGPVTIDGDDQVTDAINSGSPLARRLVSSRQTHYILLIYISF